MLYTPQHHADNLRTLRDLIAILPGDQYSAVQMADNLNAQNLFSLPPSEWTGPGCALAHAFRSGLFPGLVASPDTINCHETVFGPESEFLFGLAYQPSGAPRHGEPARQAMLDAIDALLEKNYSNCDLGMGCDEVKVCYAMSQDRPEMCGRL